MAENTDTGSLTILNPVRSVAFFSAKTHPILTSWVCFEIYRKFPTR